MNQKKVENAINDPFLSEIAQKIKDLFEEMGRPKFSPSLRVRCSPPYDLVNTFNTIYWWRENWNEYWNGKEQEAIDAYNTAIIRLYELIDYSYINEHEWDCDFKPDRVYIEFRNRALVMITLWVYKHSALNFCNLDPYHIKGTV